MKVFRVLLFAVCLAAFPLAANADMGLPLIAVFLPPMWLALIPVILIEAIVVSRLTSARFNKVLIPVSLGNLVSTLIGIPIAWITLATLEAVCCDDMPALGPFGSQIYAVTIQSPWLMPEVAQSWLMISVALLVFAIPMFAVSVLIESPINFMFARGTAKPKIWKATALANLASYICLALLIWPVSKLPTIKFFYDLDIWFIYVTASLVKAMTTH
ncbi:MAG TPA: hypothetical protein VN693_00420 [Rhodanobacteraceae bacterium]|nr:hypothetical protein [Rhodanobacteraceae bacterium]